MFITDELQTMTEDDWHLRLANETERARNQAILKKLAVLETYREKVDKYQSKWMIYENKS